MKLPLASLTHKRKKELIKTKSQAQSITGCTNNMARTVRIKVYKFNELSEPAKEKARDWYRGGNDLEHCWEYIKDDAEEVGLKIISLDDHRQNKGEFTLSANEVAANIFRDHGEGCETYKTARKFMDEWEPVFANYMQTEEGEDKLMEMEDDFLQQLLEDYRILYNQDLEWNASNEAVDENILINEYEFTQDGKRF